MEKHRRLINASLRGDSSAFEEIYRLHAPRLMGVCLRYAPNATEAQDILQESFIKIYEKLSTFRTEGSFEGWIHRITVNVALDDFRKKQRSPINATLDLKDVESEKDTSVDIFSQVSHQDLLRLVQELSPAYRMVFNLYIIEGYKHQEIAKMLNISEGTSKSNLSDARKILKMKVEKLMYEGSGGS